ncbi:phage tail protein [Massilia sp. TS11]|uniref:phage tail protein n=1 Tax=Massilia sp. TS11 TaxID=2908003 RepID=UPI001EDA81F0|nr:tail fiber protein [Massilia sp. TS11]MCG2585069.1 tail fiber protein [Massilia sp. TS11]
MAEPYIGEIRLMPIAYAPSPNFLPCDGRRMPIAGNEALFSLIGSTYGGDGTTYFCLPDLRGRVPIGISATHLLGKAGGSETVSLTAANWPAHTHTAACSNGAATTVSPAGAFFATNSNAVFTNVAPNTSTSPYVTQTIGGGQAHTNLMPFGVLNYVIATNGLYPDPA